MQINETYLLVVIPPKEVINFVDDYRQKYAHYTEYIIPPHLTVIPPFYNELGSETKLIESLKNLYFGQKIFEVNINTVGFFEGKNNVAFFKPDEKSTTKLQHLVSIGVLKTIDIITNKYTDYPTDPKTFIPHLTIAEQVPQSDFEKIKYELGKLNIEKRFEANSVVLLKNDSVDWTKIIEILF